MQKAIRAFLMLLAVALSLAPVSAVSQEGSRETNPTPPKAIHVQPYRLDFSFNEMLDGKIVNTRHYSMNLTAGNADQIKIGTRVPVPLRSSPNQTTATEYQYMDVGTNISAQLREVGDELRLVVQGDVSNLDMETGDRIETPSPPVVRQIKIDGDTLLVVGKPIMIGSVDDPNSKRQFQLEVTVTKLR